MDKNRLLQVYLEQQTAPKVLENTHNEWITYGDGEYKNLYPQFLIDMYNSSATHSAIINATASMVAGGDIIIEEEGNDLSAFVQLKKFLASVNRNGDTAHEIITKCAFDLKLFGAYALNVIWSKDKSKIAEIHHIPVEQVRIGKKNESGIVDEYYVSSDWTNYRKKEYTPRRVASFNTQDRTEASQIIYCGIYSPGMEVYYTPDYLASMNWVLTDHLTSEYHLSNIKNGFHPSFWINFNNGVPTQEERFKIEQQIKEKFTGVNAGRFVLTFSDDKNNSPDLQPIQVSDADKQYTVLNELCIQNIMIGHRVTSPMLLGVKTEGQLGGRNELATAFELYTNTVVNPLKDIALKGLRMVLNVNNINLPILLSEVSPLSSMFDSDVLKDVLTQDEIREHLGYEPLAQEQNVGLCKHDLSENITDKDAIDYINSLTLENEYTIEDDYMLIDEEKAEDDNHNYNFAVDIPNATGKEGKSNKDKQLFKIRYVYRGGKAIENTRDFCRTMLNTHYNSLFTREDITGMSNPEFGNYNIFRFKGSFNCRHYWLRRLYVLRKAPRKMVIDGVTYEKGDYLPKDVKNYYPRNKGYVPKDAGVPPLNSAEKQANKINDKVVK